MKKSLTLLLVVIATTIFAQNTYYVSNNGNDSNNGLSPATAFSTLQHASDIVSAGDVVRVENGTYAGFDIRNKNGTSANPIAFIATGNNVVVNQRGPIRNDIINIENADYVIVDGFITRDAPTGNGLPGGNGIRVVVSDHCIVRNNFCDNNAERGIFTGFTDDILIENNVCANSIDEHGIYVSNSSDRPIIRYNECYGNSSTGIQINADVSSGGDGITSDAQIYGNILHDNNGAAGINLDGAVNAVIYNNLIYNNHFSQGIALFRGDAAVVSSGAKIYNNTIIVPPDGRWGILVKAGANANTQVYNNIILNLHAWRGCIALESTAGFSSDYNILYDKMSVTGDGSTISLAAWQGFGFDANSILADPLAQIFTNPTANDYTLAPGSQAIDAGTNLVSTIVVDDLAKKNRPMGAAYDIGAYEYEAIICPTSDIPGVVTEMGDVYLKAPCYGIILTSPNGSCFRIKISDSGTLITETITCP